ncbi:MAG TPA: hypothetical protein VIK60_12010 [Vicinamibacterales bacterium]
MFKERFLSAACACAVVAGIAALNDDIHQFVAGVLTGTALTGFPQVGGGTMRIANTMPNTLALYTADHMMLVFFGLGAVVLLGLMLRT